MKQKQLQKLWLRVGMIVAVMTTAFAGTVKAESVTYSLTPNQVSTGSIATDYITTMTEFSYNGISWKMNQWNPSTLQIITNQTVVRDEFNFHNTSAFPGKITQVVISFSNLNVINTAKLLFKGGVSEVTTTGNGTAGTWDATTKTLTWTPASSDEFTYFAFYQNGKAANGNNFLANTDAIVVTYVTPEYEYESVSVGDLKYSTYASDNALDFTGSSIKAFYPTVDGSTLIFHEIMKVPAGTGVLLYSANGAVTEDILVCTGETDVVENNVFVRGTGASVSYNETTQDYIYVLSKPQGDNLGFYKANNNKVAANRAYIQVPAELSGAKSFTINLEDDPTGIVDLNANLNLNEGIYNLSGQRLSKMQKGINIVNGKKIMVK